MAKKISVASIRDAKARRLPRLSLFFFNRPRMTALLALALFIFGIVSYTTLLKREGFPSISVPFSMASGAYIVDNPAKVDQGISKPLSDVITKVNKVKTVQSRAGANFYEIDIQYDEGTDPQAGSDAVKRAVEAAKVLPANATADFRPLSIGVDTRGDDMLLAFYSKTPGISTQTLYKEAQAAAAFLTQNGSITLAKNIEAIDPFVHGTDTVTGEAAATQKVFDRFGVRSGNTNSFHTSVAVGVKGVKGFDVLELDKQMRAGLNKLNASGQFQGYHGDISYSAAPDINDQINGLQHSLLDGLVAVLVVSALLIAIRASLITVGAMIAVLLSTLGFLYLIGYSLNTITLFSLILCISLIVDDTIIMVEAIDAQRRRVKTAHEAISTATQKISRAMIAATLTATIGFAPLLFAGGILGSFIHAIPVTVIASLFISLIIALTFIPFLSRFFLLRPQQMGHGEAGDKESVAHRVEAFVAGTLCRPLMWANHKRKRLLSVGIAALVIGFGFIFSAGFIFQQKVAFNVFPSDKDGDYIMIQLAFDPNLSIDQAQQVADRADSIVAQQLGPNFKEASYFDSGTAQGAPLTIKLLSFKKRVVTVPQLSERLNKAFVGFAGAQVKAAEAGVGPGDQPFNVRIKTANRAAAYRAAPDISDFLSKTQLKRPNGKIGHLEHVIISNPDTLLRENSNAYVDVSADFDGKDTSTLVTLAQSAVKAKFNDKQMANYGLKGSNISFDTGSEGDFQDSFKKMVFAFPILLILIYVLMAIQFRSMLQPLLIFMAIPFSLFGIVVGLWLTHNDFSFFSMLGFFALIGLSIKNTILLTDYANQARRAGHGAVEAVAISLKERFRPLIATSLAAIVSLIPLYFSNPFWEGLAATLMFGLLSSTFLVLTVFPYYYLGAEYLRSKISRKGFFKWLLLNVVVVGAVSRISPTAGPIAFLLLNLGLIVFRKFISKKPSR